MKRIAILMSDTGGGHRAAANAIVAGLEARYPGMVHVDLVDMYRNYTPFPLSKAPELYPVWLRYSMRTYVWYWRFFDWLLKHKFMMHPAWGWFFAPSIRDIVKKYQPDLLLCAHAAFARSTVAGRDYAGLNLPVCSIVIEPGACNRSYFHSNADVTLVPCETSFARGVEAGIPPERLRRIGFPVRPRFANYRASKAEARRELGWDENCPTVLLLGGAEGVGALEAIARAINDRAMDNARIAVCCGKNAKLLERLQSAQWHRPVHLYGYVTNIEVQFRAADVVVMKGGPASIYEAAMIGTPMIISGAIPYQETPTCDMAIAAGAAIDCAPPKQIAQTVEELFRPGNPTLGEMAAGCRKLITPDMAYDAADEIATMLGLRSVRAAAG